MNGSTGGGSNAIDELQVAFDTLGRSSPDAVDAFVISVIRNVSGRALSDSDINTAVERAFR